MATQQIPPLAKMALVLRRAEPAQPVELVGEVRLIEEAAGERDAGPVDVSRSLRERMHVLNTANAAEQLWRKAYLGGEDRKKAPMAQAGLSRDILNPRPDARCGEAAERKRNDGMQRAATLKSMGQNRVKVIEAGLVRCRSAQSLAQLARGRVTPEPGQIDVVVRELTARHSKNDAGAPRFEVYAHHRRVLHRIDDERTGVRARHRSGGKRSGAGSWHRAVDPHLVVMEVEDELDGATR